MPPPYEPLKQCLYCGRRQPEVPTLTDEHILALSLGGYPILPESSCPDCQNLTHKFEGIVTRDLLLAIRTHLKVRTRRPRNRPMVLPTTGGEVPVIRHPAYLTLQDFNHPEILGFPNAFAANELSVRIHTTPETGRRHKALGEVGVPIRFDERAIRLTLAKTAHAYAVAELGLNSFRPLLPDLILGRMPNRASLVGAIPGANNYSHVPDGINEMPPLYHLLELRRVTSSLGGKFLSCEIALFKPLGMPVYQVIVGSGLSDSISGADPIRSFRQDL